MRDKPRNTSRDLPGAAALLLSGTGAIETQEARGQAELVDSLALPTDMFESEHEWEALGVRFGEVFSDDPLFTMAWLPKGWSKQPTDHSMHTNIVDDAGNVRGSMFYKAAFYDRRASMGHPYRRYVIHEQYGPRSNGSYYEGAKHLTWTVVDQVTGATMFSESETVTLASPDDGGDHRTWWNARDRASERVRDKVAAWLAATYPDHDDPTAYWPTRDESGSIADLGGDSLSEASE